MTTVEKQQPFLSVVVPAYNEEARIEGPLGALSSYLQAQSFPSEILVVDDGSSDRTADLVRTAAERIRIPLTLLRYGPNRGKGYALKVGFAHAAGERILYTDADLSTPIDEATRLLATLDEGFDLAIGSRKLPGSEIQVHQPWYRERLGKVFTWLVRRILADVSDVTCGFKAFRGEVGRDLFARIRIYDWAYDAELLFLAEEQDLRIKEVPVRWKDEAGTKVRLLRDVWSCTLGLIRILRNRAAGIYREPNAPSGPVECWRTGYETERAAAPRGSTLE